MNAHHGGGHRQRLVQRQHLLAVQDLLPLDAGGRVLHPELTGGQHDGKSRKAGQAALRALVDELQVIGRHRVARGRAEAERVEDRVALLVALGGRRERPMKNLFVVQRHAIARVWRLVCLPI